MSKWHRRSKAEATTRKYLQTHRPRPLTPEQMLAYWAPLIRARKGISHGGLKAECGVSAPRSP